MNTFELTFVMSICAGPITGGIAGRSFGVLGVVLGILVGIVVGLVCYFIVLKLSEGLARVCHSMDDPPKSWMLFVPWWIANVTSVMMMMMAPVGTVAVTIWLAALVKIVRDQW